ncbi:hypothetical protein L873DRAFT_684353 [Choiromyces venosus 120613-1]|uniref:Uncharacterized protein n=1 Tax=Choiromyces venosus 120613-1 TaxID=1336337 RepID=A0A3N4JS14_9PEZI|nr:hypothetical protein L873DRAFT_684353 [Choiromyces venosus 120613-1]
MYNWHTYIHTYIHTREKKEFGPSKKKKRRNQTTTTTTNRRSILQTKANRTNLGVIWRLHFDISLTSSLLLLPHLLYVSYPKTSFLPALLYF